MWPLVEGPGFLDGLATVVHVRGGFHEEDLLPVQDALGGEGMELHAVHRDALLPRQFIQREPPDVVAGVLIFGARVSEPRDNIHGSVSFELVEKTHFTASGKFRAAMSLRACSCSRSFAPRTTSAFSVTKTPAFFPSCFRM